MQLCDTSSISIETKSSVIVPVVKVSHDLVELLALMPATVDLDDILRSAPQHFNYCYYILLRKIVRQFTLA